MPRELSDFLVRVMFQLHMFLRSQLDFYEMRMKELFFRHFIPHSPSTIYEECSDMVSELDLSTEDNNAEDDKSVVEEKLIAAEGYLVEDNSNLEVCGVLSQLKYDAYAGHYRIKYVFWISSLFA
jgi:hypothetical protein